MKCDIRPERPEDEAAIARLTESAFLGAVHRSGTEQFIVAQLRRAGALRVSLVAEVDTEDADAARINVKVQADAHAATHSSSGASVSSGDVESAGADASAGARPGARAITRRQIVGHVAVSPVTVSSGATGWFGLGPLSVAPGWQGRGIGAALMTEAMTALRALGAGGCVLLGDPAYYRRFGFEPAPGLVLPGVPPAYFMAKPLAAEPPEGIVSYHEAFNASA